MASVSRSFRDIFAEIYSCETMKHKHIPPMERYCFNRPSSSNGGFAIADGDGVYSDASSPYSMHMQSGATAGSDARVVIPYAFPYNGNFLDMSVVLHDYSIGTGDLRIFIGLTESGSDGTLGSKSQIVFYRSVASFVWRWYVSDGVSSYTGDVGATSLGRDLQDGDLLTVRLYRLDSSNVDSWAFYVNGLRIAYGENSDVVPASNLYPVVGAYCQANSSVQATLQVRTFCFDYIP